MNIKISHASIGDEAEIAKVAHSLKLDKPTKYKEKTGFLIFPKSEEVYRKRIGISKHFIVAKHNAKIVGFLLAHDFEELKKLGKDMSYTDNIYNFVINYPQCCLYRSNCSIARLPRKGHCSKNVEFLDKFEASGIFFSGVIA